MFSEHIGTVLKSARRRLDLSREELARLGGVSPRLVAELERGQRPNVSLETALKLLNVVGVSVLAKAPNRISVEIGVDSAATSERAARAARRRQTWTGRHVFLHDEREDPLFLGSPAKGLVAVARVSKQAHAIASARRRRPARQAKGRSGR